MDTERMDGAADDSKEGLRRFSPALMHAAARLYYEQDATQAEIAQRLGTSRPTVSRLLAEARRTGMVRIEILPPEREDDAGLARDAAKAANLRAVHIAPPSHASLGLSGLSTTLADVLVDVGLDQGDVLLLSSGRTVYEVAQGALPSLRGVTVVPTIGGHDEPQVWYQPNEITRQFAERVHGIPHFLFAPAMPSPALYERLIEDAATRAIFELWKGARCAILGVGGPPLARTSLPRFVPTDAEGLRTAVGDVCSRFYDADGAETDFPGVERLLATSLDVLRTIPRVIAVATGVIKVPGIVAGGRAGYFHELVTDRETAAALARFSPGNSSRVDSR